MSELESRPSGNEAPLWLRLLAGFVVVVLVTSMLFALSIGVANFERIGV